MKFLTSTAVFGLAIFQCAVAVPWLDPKPTPMGLMAQVGFSPMPTEAPGAGGIPRELLRRQINVPANWCGFVDGDVENVLSCVSTKTCVFLNSAFGCCDAGLIATCTNLFTACAALGSNCDSACSANPNIIKCDAELPYCGTFAFNGGTNLYNCDTTTGTISSVEFLADYYATAAAGSSINGGPLSYTATAQTLTSQTAASSGTSASASGGTVIGPLSSSSAASTTNSGNNNNDNNSDNDDDNEEQSGSSGLSGGAIAGIAIGVVVVIGAIIAGLLTYCLIKRRRRRRALLQNNQPPTGPQQPPMQQAFGATGPQNGPGYAPVPQQPQQQQGYFPPTQPPNGQQSTAYGAPFYGQDGKTAPPMGSPPQQEGPPLYSPGASELGGAAIVGAGAGAGAGAGIGAANDYYNNKGSSSPTATEIDGNGVVPPSRVVSPLSEMHTGNGVQQGMMSPMATGSSAGGLHGGAPGQGQVYEVSGANAGPVQDVFEMPGSRH
ncbi:MAG: hypothetical protein M1827_003582 [Pycnora praestabilis]|nr:MAG: hypothetical protein M1827_003582 [Pycnora praestabilis]